MTTLTFIKFMVLVSLVLLGTYALYRENDLIIFEKKLKKVFVAFFKAAFYTIKVEIKKSKNIEPCEILYPAISEEEIAEMMAVVDKKSTKRSDNTNIMVA